MDLNFERKLLLFSFEKLLKFESSLSDVLFMSPKRFCKQFERSILTRVRVKSTRHCSVAFKEKTETVEMVDRPNTTPIFIKIGKH